jgi:Fe-Mn family superoxide dismutase
MNFETPELPYDKSALEPYIDARTVDIHYGKHHRGYMDKLRKQIEGTPDEKKELTDFIKTASGDLFNNAAQVWNHTFYWNGMKPGGGGTPSSTLDGRLSKAFGSIEAFKREFAQAANGEFGSGWAWLIVTKGGELEIVSSSDAENPIRNGAHPVLTLDVWEHAYYLDYQNERNRYVEAFLDHLINWDFVEANLDKANVE